MKTQTGDYDRGYYQALVDVLHNQQKLGKGFKVVPVDKIMKLLNKRRDVNTRKDVVVELSFKIVHSGAMDVVAAQILIRGFLEVRVFDRLRLAQELGLWTNRDTKTLDDLKIARTVIGRALEQGKLKELVDRPQQHRERDGKSKGKLWKV